MGKRLLILLIVLGAILFVITESIHVRFCIMLGTIICGVIYYKGNVLYPFVWFTPIIALYNVSIYILELFGLRIAPHFEVVLNCLYLNIVTIFICCLLYIKEIPRKEKWSCLLQSNKEKRLYILLGLFISYIILSLPLFFLYGFESKMDMNSKGGIPGFGICSNLFLLFYFICIIYRTIKMKKLPFLLILFCMVLSLMVSMIIGERDLMLSAILGTFFVYYSFNKVSKKKIALFGMLGILLVAGSTQVKQISSRSDSQNEKTLEESVFGGEFITSGRNFNTILDDKNNWNFQYGIGLCYDMIHAVIPSFIIDVPNSTGWYNERYNEMRDEGYGAGFSFLAEGYLQVGYFGVILWAIIISFIMRFLYYHSNKSVFGLAAYIFMISDIMYSMRGDFSYILSPLLKQVFLSYLLVKYVFKLYPITQMRKNKML